MRLLGVRIIVGVGASLGLVVFFLLQQIDFAAYLFPLQDTRWIFIVNRTIRFLVNDFLAIALIYALFVERKYVIFALWVQVAGLVFLLLPYFMLKYRWPTYNGPMINFLHRIILNPTLLLLLIPAFYFQQHKHLK
jgi:exosortase F-associated protein